MHSQMPKLSLSEKGGLTLTKLLNDAVNPLANDH